MLAVKGPAGRGRRGPPYTAKKVPAKIRPEDISEEEYIPQGRKAPAETKKDPDSAELPSKILVRPSDWLHMIPRSVWSQGAFRWDPQSFAVESERMNDRVIEAQDQDDSLRRWLSDPTLPLIYGVSGNPSETKARYFAAYLVDQHVRRLGARARPVWHAVFGGYRNELIEDYRGKDSMYEPTVIVLCNLATNSTPIKFEKARDILERFSHIPRIVVSAGEDPLSFLSTKLCVPTNAMAYFSESLMRKRLEII